MISHFILELRSNGGHQWLYSIIRIVDSLIDYKKLLFMIYFQIPTVKKF